MINRGLCILEGRYPYCRVLPSDLRLSLGRRASGHSSSVESKSHRRAGIDARVGSWVATPPRRVGPGGEEA